MTSIWVGTNIIPSSANADNTYLSQQFKGVNGIVVGGNTVFTLTSFLYVPATGSLDVYIDGVFQKLNVDFTETSNVSFTVIGLVLVDTDIVAKGLIGGTAAQAAQVSATQAAAAALASIAAYNNILGLALPSLPLSVANGGTGTTTGVPPRALVLLANLTPTVANQINFLNVFNSTYDDYLVIGEGLNMTGVSGASLSLELAVGGVLDTAANYITTTSTSTATVTSSSIVSVLGNIITGVSGCNLELNFKNMNSTLLKTVEEIFTGQLTSAPTGIQYKQGALAYVPASPVTGFALFWGSSANFTATGSIKVYGYAKV